MLGVWFHPNIRDRQLDYFHSFTFQLEILTQLKKALVDVKPSSFEDCVKWARQLFQDYYFNTIAQLLYNFPPDHVRSVSG